MRTTSSAIVNLERLERVIRKVVREELSRVVRRGKGESEIERGSPLYQDLLDIARRKKRGRVKLYPRSKVISG